MSKLHMLPALVVVMIVTVNHPATGYDHGRWKPMWGSVPDMNDRQSAGMFFCMFFAGISSGDSKHHNMTSTEDPTERTIPSTDYTILPSAIGTTDRSALPSTTTTGETTAETITTTTPETTTPTTTLSTTTPPTTTTTLPPTTTTTTPATTITLPAATTMFPLGFGAIVGMVKLAEADIFKNTPLPNVTVTATNVSLTIGQTATDANGMYSLMLPEYAGYSLNFSAAGYYPAKMADIVVTANENTTMETPRLIPGTITGLTRVKGTVYNAEGTRREPYVSLLIRPGLNVKSGPYTHTTADEYANFNFDVEPGYYTVELAKPGFIPNILMAVSAFEKPSTTLSIGSHDERHLGVISPVYYGTTRILVSFPRQTIGLVTATMTGPGYAPKYQRSNVSSSLLPPGSASMEPFMYAFNGRGDFPQIITMYKQNQTGIYRFSVSDATSSGKMFVSSDLRVQVLQGATLIKTYFSPKRPGNTWAVFQLIGNNYTKIDTVDFGYPE